MNEKKRFLLSVESELGREIAPGSEEHRLVVECFDDSTCPVDMTVERVKALGQEISLTSGFYPSFDREHKEADDRERFGK